MEIKHGKKMAIENKGVFVHQAVDYSKIGGFAAES